MSNTAVKITPELLKGKATNMKSLVDRMRAALDVSTTQIRATEEFFKGTGPENVRNQYEELRPKFEDFYNTMTEFANFLDLAATKYAEQDESIAKNAENLVSNYSE